MMSCSIRSRRGFLISARKLAAHHLQQEQLVDVNKPGDWMLCCHRASSSSSSSSRHNLSSLLPETGPWPAVGSLPLRLSLSKGSRENIERSRENITAAANLSSLVAGGGLELPPPVESAPLFLLRSKHSKTKITATAKTSSPIADGRPEEVPSLVESLVLHLSGPKRSRKRIAVTGKLSSLATYGCLKHLTKNIVAAANTSSLVADGRPEEVPPPVESLPLHLLGSKSSRKRIAATANLSSLAENGWPKLPSPVELSPICLSQSERSRKRIAASSLLPVGRPKGPSPIESIPLRLSRSERYRKKIAAAASAAASPGFNLDGSRIPLRIRRLLGLSEVSQKKKMRMKMKCHGPMQFEDLTAKVPDHSELPFAFRWSYTEIPKVAPVGFREKFSPFGPGRLDRPWDGEAAEPVPSLPLHVPEKPKKEKHVLDSFNPPPHKKKMKPITPPGPFLPGQGPKKGRTREEILGEPLTKEEIRELVENNYKSRKQINLGRDGLTHNMLINFHYYWKRDRIVRVKCKGVSTVDMDNVMFQIEDKTGGNIIERVNGTLYVFRGRNYNYKDRPHIPVMLWRPHSPIYPKLIPDQPGGLKVHEANQLRKRGREILPLCRLAKNGYYGDLVQNVREAFEVDDLVRVDCTGLGRSDYKKIGSKLRDLVPCVLVSFKGEQILMWRGESVKSEAELEQQLTMPHADTCNTAICESTTTHNADAKSTVICQNASILNDNQDYEEEDERSMNGLMSGTVSDDYDSKELAMESGSRSDSENTDTSDWFSSAAESSDYEDAEASQYLTTT